MEVRLKRDTESRLQELASVTGRPADELIEDAMAGYLEEIARTPEVLDSRYDDVESGQVRPVDGEEVFARPSKEQGTPHAKRRGNVFTRKRKPRSHPELYRGGPRDT